MPKKEYKYFTEVLGQKSSYMVKHLSKKDQRIYERILKSQVPYFNKIKSGKL